MIKRSNSSICIFILYALLTMSVGTLHAQAKTPVQEMDTLKVGIAGTAPFIIQNDNEYSGIAVEIWESISTNSGWKYTYVPFKNVREALSALDNGTLDLVVGPVSITSERASRMKFSQPYYQSSLTILSRVEKAGLWQRIKPFFSFKLLVAIAIFLIILALVGTLIWLAERKKSPEQFPVQPVAGIANGMWLAIVTMSTTGYGDRAPITLWGRIIAGTWMIVSIIFATSMVAGIASTLTLSGMGNSTINNIEQLSGKKVATLIDSPAEKYLQDLSTTKVGVETLSEAIKMLKNKEVDAVLYDRPQLLYYLKMNKDKHLHLSTAEYYKQGYGFAFPLQTNFTHQTNINLLGLAEDKKTERIIEYWLGEARQ